jgi:predicted RNA-binding protein YlqC (UPF0109 family)
MIQKLLNFIISHIVTSGSVSISESQTESGVYEIQNASEETGKIIGKSGSIIKAIRNIASISLIKNSLSQKIFIRIVE